MARKVGDILDRLSETAGRNLLDQQRVECPRKVGCEPQALGASFALHQRCEPQLALERVDRRWHRLAVDPVERSANALVQFRVSHRD